MKPHSIAEAGAVLAAMAVTTVRKPEAPATDKSASGELQAALASANTHLAPAGQHLEMAWDRDTRQIVVKLVDAGTKEVIRQIPTEEAISLSRRLASLPDRFVASA